MRANWDNDELRRAYDQGYWDARREFEHHLALMHQGRERQGGQMPQGASGQRQGGYGEPQDYRGQGSGQDRYRQGNAGGWLPDYPGGHEGYGQGGYRDEGAGSRGGYDRGNRPGGSYAQGPPADYRGGGHDDRSRTGDYPPGNRRDAFEGSSGRGFFEQVGDEVRSWFDYGENDRNRDTRDRHDRGR